MIGLAGLLLAAAVFPVDPARVDADRLLRETVRIREATVEAVRAMVPRQAGLYFVGCPNCNGGGQERQLAWDPEHPDSIYCRFCRHRYPSEKYPENRAVEVRGPRGALHRYPYYEDSKGYRYFFSAKRDDLIKQYLAGQAQMLAHLYAKTGDRAYADRAFVILERFAEVFPDWCWHFDYPFRQKQIYPGVVPSNQRRSDSRVTRWTWWGYNAMPLDLLDAWDQIRDVVPRRDVVERGLFRDIAEELLVQEETYTNMSPRRWSALVRAGRILGDRRYVNAPISRFRTLVDTKFFYDGAWSEGSPSYWKQTMGELRNVMALTGEALRLPLLDLAAEAWSKMRFPDGRLVPFADTWSTDRDKPLTESVPFLLPGLGHAALAGGESSQQWQAHLHWGGGYGHSHADRLSLNLFARGREALSDLGYTHGCYRSWTLATAAHNTVVIDERNQVLEKGDGALERFDVSDGRVQVVSARGERAYPGLASRYRRTLVAVEGKYLIDWFEVEGGSVHDYFLHGDADAGGTVSLPGMTAGTPVPPRSGWKPTVSEGEVHRILEPGYAFGFLGNEIKHVAADAGCVRVEMPERLNVHFCAEAGDELYTGQNPAIRGAQENDARIDDFLRGHFRARRRGGHSVFVAVIELNGSVKSVQRIEGGVRVDGVEWRPGDLVRERPRGPVTSLADLELPVRLITADGYVYPVRNAADLSAFEYRDGTLRLLRCPGRTHSGALYAEP